MKYAIIGVDALAQHVLEAASRNPEKHQIVRLVDARPNLIGTRMGSLTVESSFSKEWGL